MDVKLWALTVKEKAMMRLLRTDAEENESKQERGSESLEKIA